MNIEAINGEWFYDDVTTRGVSFDGFLPGACKIPLGNMQDFELIHTPEKMAEFQSNEWYQKNWRLADTLTTFAPLGSEKSVLVDAYRSEMEKILSFSCDSESCQHDASSDVWPTQGSCRGLQVLLHDLCRYEQMMTANNDMDEGKFYDVKKEIYRLTDRVFAALAKCYAIEANSSFAILDKLYKKEVISSEARDNLASASAIAIKLRLSTYLRAGKQGEQLSSNPNEDTGKIASVYLLPNDEELFHFFFVAIPLYDELRKFKTSGNVPSSLDNRSFFDDSDMTMGQLYCRLLKYDKAIECYEHALQKNPDNLSAEIRRMRIALIATHNTQNLDNLLEKLVQNFSQLDDDFDEETLEFTPLINRLDFEERQQLVNGLLFAGKIRHSAKYVLVAVNIGMKYLTLNKRIPKELFLLIFTSWKYCSHTNSQQIFDTVVSEVTSFIKNEGVSTESIVFLNGLGEFLFDQGKKEKAYRCFQRALSIGHLLYGNRRNVNIMISLQFLGVTTSSLSMFAESKFYYESLVHLFGSSSGTNTKMLLKETYLILAILSSIMASTTDETLCYVNNCLKMDTGTKNEREMFLNCFLYCQLAIILHTKQNPEQAWKFAQDAQAGLENSISTETRSKMVRIVAKTLCEIQKTTEGIKLLQKELQTFTSDSQVEEKVFCLQALGKFCLTQSLAPEATKYYSRAVEILKENPGKGVEYLQCLLGISKALIIEGSTSEAKPFMHRAFCSAKELPDSYGKCSSLWIIGDTYESICEIGLARKCYDEALNTCKGEYKISKNLPFWEITMEMKLGKLAGKMSSIDSVNSKFSMPLEQILQAERSHYDRAAVILRRHVATGKVDSTTVSLFRDLAVKYTTLDLSERTNLLLEALKVSEDVYGTNKPDKTVANILGELSKTYILSQNFEASMKYRESQLKMEMELYSSNPFHEQILSTLMFWALGSLVIPRDNDTIERVCEFFLSSLDDKDFLPNTTAQTNAARCVTFLALSFLKSGNFLKAQSLNEKASQLLNEGKESVETEDDPVRKVCILMMKSILSPETILSSGTILASHETERWKDVLISIVTQENIHASGQEHFKEANEEALHIMYLLSDALEYHTKKGDFRQAAEVHATLQQQRLHFHENCLCDGEEKLISEAIRCKNETRPYKAVTFLDVALQLPEVRCRQKLKILKLRGESFLSAGNFRNAAIDFTKAEAVYSIETIENGEDLYEYFEVLIGLIKSKILCNNVEEAWLVCERGLKMVSDHELKETINQQAVKFFYLGAKCVNILSERGEDKEDKLVQARALCEEALSFSQNIQQTRNAASDLMEELGNQRQGEFATKCEVPLLLAVIFLKLGQENEAKRVLQEMKTFLTSIAYNILADPASKEKPELAKVCCRIYSWLARVFTMLGDKEQSVVWIRASLASFFPRTLPDFLSFYQEFVPLLQAITATQSSVLNESRSPFQQAVDMCKEKSLKQGSNLDNLYQFLKTLIIIYSSLGQTQEAMVVAEIALGITDLMPDDNDNNKTRNRSELQLLLAQLYQQKASNSAFDADEEFKLAEHHYLNDRGGEEDMVLRKELSYANFLCERKRFAEAVAVLEEVRNLGVETWNKYMYVYYFSRLFYGAGVQKSVQIDGELFTTVGHVLYNLMVQAYVGMGKKKEAVGTCDILTRVNLPDVHEIKYGKRPSCKPYLVEDCHRELLSLLNENDRDQFQNCDFPLSSANLAKLYYMLGEYVMASTYFLEDVESSEMLEMKISCLRLTGNKLVDLNRGDESLYYFIQFLALLQDKEGFLSMPFHNQCEILQTYSFANPYYVFYSLGSTHSERENIDAAIQCYERCIELDEDFTCGQDIVATLSELYQTKALTTDLENKDSWTFYMDLALKLFQRLFQKTSEMTTFVELRFASLLSKLGRYEEAVKNFEKVIERADDRSILSFKNVDKPLVDVYLRGEIEAHGGSIVIPGKVLAVYELISTYVKWGKMKKAEEFALVLENVTDRCKASTSELMVVAKELKFVARSMAGYAYKLIGNKEKAAEIFLSELKVNPGHPPVTEALESCCI